MLWIQLLACFCVGSLCAQDYPWINYTVDDGLASNYVYGAIELSNGTVWAFTEKGVARFDGQQFHNYNVEDGLPDNDIFKIDRDMKGRGLMSSFSNQIAAIIGDSIHQITTNYENISGAAIIINGESYKSNRSNNSHIQIDDSTKVIKWDKGPYTYKSTELGVQIRHNTLKIHSLNDSTDNWQIKLSQLSSELGHFDTIDRSNKFTFGPTENHVIFINPEGWLIADVRARTFEEKVWKSYGFVHESNFSIDAVWIAPELIIRLPNGYIRIDSLGNEVEAFDIGDIKKEAEILNVIPDKKGNIWMGTQGSGLYFLPQHNRTNRNLIKLHPKSNGIEKLLPTKSGDILALPDDGHPLRIHPNFKTEAITSISLENFIDIEEIRNDNYLITNTNTFQTSNNCFSVANFVKSHSTFIYKTESRTNKSFVSSNNNGKLFAFDKSSDVILFTTHSAGRLSVMKSHSDSLTMWDHDIEINSFSKTTDGGVWIAAKTGVFKHFKNQLIPIFEHPSLQLTVSLYQNEEKLFFATQDDDIYSLDLDTKEFKKLANLNSINRIRKGTNNTLLACTNHGLIKLDELTGEVIREYKVSSGLSSNQINDVYETNTDILVASNVGVDRLPVELKNEIESHIPFKITSFLVNNQLYDFTNDQLKFNNLQNNVQLKYTLQDYQSAGDVKYYTKLSPLQNDWQESKVPSVDYWGLSPGDYTFELKAKRYNGQELHHQKAIRFTIKPTLLKNPLFYLIAFGLGLGLFFWITQKKQAKALDALKQKNVMNKKISELQLSALRSQMNPHFIFNALGAIQYFIQTQDAEMAEDYLSQFAFLMRKYLDASKRPMINLTEEIELLELYTGIEVMRYDQRFEVEIHVDEEIDRFDTMIPSVLIQPFVENSILHGLHSRKRAGGLLKITFSQIGDDLHVIISDNGIGLKKSKKQSNSFHTPTGLINISDRIKTISYSTGMKIDLSYNIPFPEDELYPGHEVALVFTNTIS